MSGEVDKPLERVNEENTITRVDMSKRWLCILCYFTHEERKSLKVSCTFGTNKNVEVFLFQKY